MTYSNDDATTIGDGFGNWWPAECERCGAPMQIVRPGVARCSAECDLHVEVVGCALPDLALILALVLRLALGAALVLVGLWLFWRVRR